jgi:hypothetical protein
MAAVLAPSATSVVGWTVRVRVCGAPAVTVIRTAALRPSTVAVRTAVPGVVPAVKVARAMPPAVAAGLGATSPSGADRVKVTGVPSATGCPQASVTVTVMAAVLVPSATASSDGRPGSGCTAGPESAAASPSPHRESTVGRQHRRAHRRPGPEGRQRDPAGGEAGLGVTVPSGADRVKVTGVPSATGLP